MGRMADAIFLVKYVAKKTFVLPCGVKQPAFFSLRSLPYASTSCRTRIRAGQSGRAG